MKKIVNPLPPPDAVRPPPPPKPPSRDKPYTVTKANGWVPAGMLMPPVMTDVLVVVKNPAYGQRWTTIARWIPNHSVLAEEFMAEDWDFNYSHWKDGVEYVPEGWWELCGDEYRMIIHSVTHWMFKPELPKES